MARKSRKASPIKHEELRIKNVLRVAGYVRLSVEDRNRKSDSVENQRAIITDFVGGHSNFELVEVYVDNGVSGQTFERPAFARMIADVESGRINCCVVKDLSRLGRNAIDAGYYVEKYFPARDVRFIAVTDDYDSADPDSGAITLGLKNMFNEAFALEIGRKIRQSKQANIRKGLYVGRLAPYGYFRCRDNKHQLVIDPYAAGIVRQIFEKAVSGESVRSINDWLSTSGILPPKLYYHSIGLVGEKETGGRKHWGRGVIYNILKNQMYCGDMVQGRSKCVSYNIAAVPKSDWVIVKNTHEAIISREMFDEVQKLRTKGGGGV